MRSGPVNAGDGTFERRLTATEGGPTAASTEFPSRRSDHSGSVRKPPPGPGGDRWIETIGDPVLRNLRVTWAYHELANAVAARTGPWINWCAMATWASRQAGRTIRSEDVDAVAERIVARVLHGPAADALIAALRSIGARPDVASLRAGIRRTLGLEDALRRSSEAVSRGNIKVFTEIGREFSRFLDTLDAFGIHDEAAVRDFCEAMPPGDPPGGRGWLRNVFRHQHEAMVESDRARAAQRQMLANLEIGFHEQVRLQTEIAAGIEAPLADADALLDRLLVELFPFGGAFAARPRRHGLGRSGRANALHLRSVPRGARNTGPPPAAVFGAAGRRRDGGSPAPRQALTPGMRHRPLADRRAAASIFANGTPGPDVLYTGVATPGGVFRQPADND